LKPCGCTTHRQRAADLVECFEQLLEPVLVAADLTG
jgi:hypothetical protein